MQEALIRISFRTRPFLDAWTLKTLSFLRAFLCLQTGYLVLVEYSGAESGMTSSEIMLYNAVLSLPVLSVLIVATGEASVSFPTLIREVSVSEREGGFVDGALTCELWVRGRCALHTVQ